MASASIGVPIPQFRGRSCPYRLPLYGDFVLLYPCVRERRGWGEGPGSCLHLKTFVMKPQESQAVLFITLEPTALLGWPQQVRLIYLSDLLLFQRLKHICRWIDLGSA